MSAPCLRLAPHWWMIPACIAGIAIGIWFLWWPPDPFADLAPGQRPLKLALFFKVAGGLLVLAAIYRLFALKWVTVESDALMVATLLSKRRHGWSRLTDIHRDPGQYRLVFRSGTVALARREYRPADLAALDSEVSQRRG